MHTVVLHLERKYLNSNKAQRIDPKLTTIN